MIDASNEINDYINYLSLERQLSVNTVDGYRRDLVDFYKFTNKRLDVHLMVSEPEKYIENYSTLNTEYITIHLEIIGDINKYIQMIKSYGIKAGIAIKPNTNVRDIVPYLPYIDLILVMSVEPGEGGQEFISGSDDKIREIRKLLEEYNINDVVVSVDGGVNDKTIEYCRDCDIVVSGSYIINSDNFQEKIDTLR